MVAVFKNTDDIVVVNEAWIERVKENARLEPLRRARLNMHRSDDDIVQEMLIAFCRESINPPHRHVGKIETLHAIEGRVKIVFLDDGGTILKQVTIGSFGTGLPRLYRLSAPLWRVVIPLDELVVVHEVATGPFPRPPDIVPEWMPDGDEAMRMYIDRLRVLPD